MEGLAVPDNVVRIIGHRLPGRAWCEHANVHVGIQHGHDITDLVRADADVVIFNVPVAVYRDPMIGTDFRGPYVHGPRDRRFIYLSWGNVDDNARFTMFRRAKINFATMPEHILRALADGCTIQTTLNLTGRDGGPLCASVPADAIGWLISDAATG